MKKSRWLLSLVCVCLSAGCGASMPVHSVVAGHFERGEYREAALAADRGLQQNPDDPALWRTKIAATARTGDHRGAVELYMEWHRLRRHYDLDALRRLAISTLWHGLQDPSPAARVRAIELATRLAFDDVRDVLVERMSDDDAVVAAASASALLGRHRDARARALALLSSPEPRARALLIAGFGRSGDDRDQAILVQALDDPAPEVRRTAVTALGRHFAARAQARLLEVARSDSQGSVRAAALRALGASKLADDQAASIGRSALGDEYLGARLAGLALITRRHPTTRGSGPSSSSSRSDPAALLELIQTLPADDVHVALRLAVALRAAGGETPARVTQMIQLGLGHSSWNTRVATLNALAELVPAATAQDMAGDRINDPRPEVRLAAARVLTRTGASGRAGEVAAAELASPRGDIRVQAAVDLLRLDDPRGEGALGALSRNPSPDIRRAAAAAYRETEQPTLPLVTVLGDPAVEVRLEAAAALLHLLD